MIYLKIHSELLTSENISDLLEICPFSAIEVVETGIEINAGCRMCKLCVDKGPKGVIGLEDDQVPSTIDKSEWRGVTVFVEHQMGKVHNVTKELIGKARELADVCGQSVYALFIGHQVQKAADSLLCYGVDKVFCYDEPQLAHFLIDPYANAFSDFIEKVKPSTILVGATNIGRSLAPRVAARFRTGLTADCTVLQMKENSDLVQIRPAFGGNIMAQIVTPKHRPQFCTVRYKVFEIPSKVDNPSGEVVRMTLSDKQLESRIELLKLIDKPKQEDISEAQVIVAVGRGLKNKNDLLLVKELADMLDAQLAVTRPLVEAGWADARRQIGLSGRTVNAKLIITLGISGMVQFAAGMRNSECIIAVNSDENAPIFDIAHYGLVGDLYEILPEIIRLCKGVAVK